jgi:hypothetical protein
MFQGNLSYPDTFTFPVITQAVLGAWVSNVVPGDPRVEPAFVATARSLVRHGAVALTTNCGFAIRHQRAIASAVSVPVATSALLLVPMVAATTSGTVGIVTFDARPLTQGVLRLAGVAEDAPIAVVGLEGTDTWEIMSRPDAPITPAQIEDDLLVAIASLRKREPSLSALVLECAGFPVAAPKLREVTRLPVYDVTSLANLLMAGVWQPRKEPAIAA